MLCRVVKDYSARQPIPVNRSRRIRPINSASIRRAVSAHRAVNTSAAFSWGRSYRSIARVARGVCRASGCSPARSTAATSTGASRTTAITATCCYRCYRQRPAADARCAASIAKATSDAARATGSDHIVNGLTAGYCVRRACVRATTTTSASIDITSATAATATPDFYDKISGPCWDSLCT